MKDRMDGEELLEELKRLGIVPQNCRRALIDVASESVVRIYCESRPGSDLLAIDWASVGWESWDQAKSELFQDANEKGDVESDDDNRWLD